MEGVRAVRSREEMHLWTVLIGKATIMDDDLTYRYFCENIEAVSKMQLLEALQSALQSAHCWREACLLGFPAAQPQSSAVTDRLSSKEGQTA